MSVATNEHSFSTLTRVNSYVKNTTGHNRLNELALMSVHRVVFVDPDIVLDKLARKKDIL